MKYRRRSRLFYKCIKCNREATCIRPRPCLYEVDGGRVKIQA